MTRKTFAQKENQWEAWYREHVPEKVEEWIAGRPERLVRHKEWAARMAENKPMTIEEFKNSVLRSRNKV